MNRHYFLALLSICVALYAISFNSYAEFVTEHKAEKLTEKKDILGVWYNPEKAIEFSADNQYIRHSFFKRQLAILKYKVIKNNTLTLTGSLDFTQYTNALFHFEIDKGVLTIFPLPFGSPSSYTKATSAQLKRFKGFKKDFNKMIKENIDKQKSKIRSTADERADTNGCAIIGDPKITKRDPTRKLFEYKCQQNTGESWRLKIVCTTPIGNRNVTCEQE